MSASVGFPAAQISVTDNTTYSQIASYYANGTVYLKPEQGVGHIYSPVTALFCIGVMKGLVLSPSPYHVRLLLHAAFIMGVGLLLIVAAMGIVKALKLNTRADFALCGVAVLTAFSSSVFAVISNVQFDSVHYFHVLVLLLGIFAAVLYVLHSQKFKALLWALVPVLAASIFFTCPPFVLITAAVLPVYVQQRQAWCRNLVSIMTGLGVAIGLCSWAYVAFNLHAAQMAYWTLILPNIQIKQWAMLLSRDVLMYAALLGLLLYEMWTLKTGPGAWYAKSAVMLFAGALLLVSMITATKRGGALYNFAPYAFFVLFAIEVVMLVKILFLKQSLKLFVWLALVALAAWRIGDVHQRPITVDKGDVEQVRRLHKLLAYLEGNQAKVYVDSAPAYYASTRHPYEFEASHMWELSVAGNREGQRALTDKLQKKYYDYVIVHLSRDSYDIARRCLGEEIMKTIESNYTEIGSFGDVRVARRYICDIYFNSRISIFSKNTDQRSMESVMSIVNQDLTDQVF